MNQLVFGALAVTLVIIVAMSLSANSIGARLVQGMLAVTIIALLVRGNSGIQQKWMDVSRLVIQATKQPTSAGGN